MEPKQEALTESNTCAAPLTTSGLISTQILPIQKAQFQMPEEKYENIVKNKMKLEFCKNKTKIGKGTFGIVYKADYENQFTGEKKKFPVTAIREIYLLRRLQHHNIVQLQDVFSSRQSEANDGRGSFYLQFEYVKHDLQGLLEKGVKFDLSHIKCIMKQVLKGLMYLHENRTIHRDIKGANILISEDGVVKLADFGLARYLQSNQYCNYTIKVVTLWYRAPEILLGFRSYNDKIDIWSAGCFFFELLFNKVMFAGSTDKQQLDLIFQTCGTPIPEEDQTFFDYIPIESQNLIKDHPCARKLKERLNCTKIGSKSSHLSEGLIDLLDKMLKMEPSKRISAKDAYYHEYFKQDPRPCAPNELPLISEDTHEYSVKAQKKTKDSQLLQDNSSKLIEKFKKDQENKNLYRRPPDLRPLDDPELNEFNSLSRTYDNLQSRPTQKYEETKREESSNARDITHHQSAEKQNRERSIENRDRPNYRDNRDGANDRRRDRPYQKYN